MSSESTYRNQPRRRFSRAFKREVVELLLEQAATVAEIARAYDLHPNQLCRWRTEYFRGEYGEVQPAHVSEPCLLPVRLIETATAMPVASTLEEPERATTSEATTGVRRLSIVLSKGQMHLEDVDHETLGMLIEALR
ncbi:MAG: transposase [Porticoccaceae bacterium]|nr:transposase [Porticoccaceae bacterium]